MPNTHTTGHEQLKAILSFLKTAEKLKNTLRTAVTSNGRQESTAEHTWRLCLMVLVLETQYPGIDILKLLKICIIHDLGEAINGDVPAISQVDGVDKGIQERRDFVQIIAPLPLGLRKEFLSLWDEYEAAASREALLAKALDKIETLLQHVQGQCPEQIDYTFNLTYGQTYTGYDELTRNLRAMIDRETQDLTQIGQVPKGALH